MSKTNDKKLLLTRETLKELTQDDLSEIAGGASRGGREGGRGGKGKVGLTVKAFKAGWKIGQRYPKSPPGYKRNNIDWGQTFPSR